jgi:hypothetical protein
MLHNHAFAQAKQVSAKPKWFDCIHSIHGTVNFRRLYHYSSFPLAAAALLDNRRDSQQRELASIIAFISEGFCAPSGTLEPLITALSKRSSA